MVASTSPSGQGVPTQWSEAARAAGARRRRPVVAAARVHRLGAGVARARRGDAHAARVPDRGAVRVHRVVDHDRHAARRSARGAAAHGRSSARRRRAGAASTKMATRSPQRRDRHHPHAHAVQMGGYWNEPERTAEAMSPDGWILTGDLGRFRPDGNLVLCGRRTEMYIRGGYNVYPLEVEHVAVRAPGGRPGRGGRARRADDRRDRRRVRGARRPGRPPTRDELRAWCASGWPTTRRPTGSSSSTSSRSPRC